MLMAHTPALFGGKAPSQGNDAFTKLLAHFEGANNYTWFYDSSPTSHGYAGVAGAASVQNGSPLGVAANGVLYLTAANGSYIAWGNSADWDFGAGDFTIDWWEYRANAGDNRLAVCRDHTKSYQAFLCGYEASGNLLFYASSDNATWDIASAQSMGPANVGVWKHMAVCRSGNTFYTFQGGTQRATWTSTKALAPATGSLVIGATLWVPVYFNGYIEEVRISKGIARWTANFTPPSKAYSPDSVPPPATKFSVSAPGSATSGTAFNVTVTALDANNNRVPTYTGTVHLTSTNGAAVLPANGTLTNGQGVFSVTLKTGTWTVTATDTVNASITGTSAAISVAAPAAKAVALGSSQTWTVPADWNSANNYIYCIGGGGGGGASGGYGGGGGGYAIKHNIALTPNSGVGVAVGGGGAGGTGAGGVGGTGGTTSFAGIVVATGGGGGGNYSFGGNPGAGGGAAAGDGGYVGGAGGLTSGTGGAGGGGSGGTYGNGAPGGTSDGIGGSGGGGCGGGSAGGVNSGNTGGNGGNSPWAAGGVGTFGGTGGAGTNGSGGGGAGGANGTGGAGGNAPDYSGGGGGGASGTGNYAGNGGYYGGGAGGGYYAGGAGAQGVIFIWWQPT